MKKKSFLSYPDAPKFVLGIVATGAIGLLLLYFGVVDTNLVYGLGGCFFLAIDMLLVWVLKRTVG